MSAPESSPQRASPFGAAAFTKAINVVAHYVDFSDRSSSWNGSQSDGEGTETPDNNEDLREPLLQNPSPASAGNAALQDGVECISEDSAHTDAMPAHKTASVSEELQNPAQVDVQSHHEQSDGSSLSDDGAQTPTKQDLRTPLLQSQPVDQEALTHASSGSPKVAASSGMEKLNSALLDPSLLQQLLDDYAPPPDVPELPIQHAEPVAVSANENAPPNGNHGKHQPAIIKGSTHAGPVTCCSLIRYTDPASNNATPVPGSNAYLSYTQLSMQFCSASAFILSTVRETSVHFKQSQLTCYTYKQCCMCLIA